MIEPILSITKVDESLPELRRKCEAVLTEGKALVVSSQTKPIIGELLVKLKVALDGLDAWRHGWVDAPNAYVTGVNTRAKELRDPLKALDDDLRRRLAKVIQAEEDAARLARQLLLDEQRRQEEERQRLEREKQRIEQERVRLEAEQAKAKQELEHAQTLGDYLTSRDRVDTVEAEQAKLLEEDRTLQATPPPVAKPVLVPAGPARRTSLGGGGSMGHTMEWTFKVDNLAEVPMEYLKLDETKVREYIAVGGRKIGGLTIYEAPVVRVEKPR